MRKPIYEAQVNLGNYTDKRDGQVKPQWTKVGVVMENNGKLSLRLDLLPLTFGQKEVWIQFFEIKKRNKEENYE